MEVPSSYAKILKMPQPEKQITDELWKRGNLTWKLHSSQLIVYKALRALPVSVREAVVLIARRWGKSYLGIIMALEDCLLGSGKQVFIVGPSLKQTRRIITPLIREICADAPKGLIKQTKSDLTWAVGESTLIIGAFDTALESFRGLKADSIYLEESGLANPEEYEYTLKSVLRPTLMHSRGRLHHLTTPPREENHPFIFSTMPEATLNEALFTYTIENNPLLSKEEIEAEISAAGGRGSEHCERELFCRIVRDTQRLIIPEFDENRHVVPLIAPEYTHYLTSIDFGGVRDNHALLLSYFDFERNKTCYLDEVWMNINTGTKEIIEAGKELEHRHNVVWLKGIPKRIIDAPDQLLIDVKRMGYECSKPQKGKDSVEDGIQAIRVAFQKDQIEIDPRCKVLIETLKYQMWDKHRKDFQRTDILGHGDMLASQSYAHRHQDRHNNPFPPNLGMHKDIHYFIKQKQSDNESVLAQAFLNDD